MEGTYDNASQVQATSNATTNAYSSDLPNYINPREVMENGYELMYYFKTEVENYELSNRNSTTNHTETNPITDGTHNNEMDMDMELPMYVENDMNVTGQSHDYYLDNNQHISESPMILPSFQVSDKIFELPPLEMDPSNLGKNYFNPNQMNFVQNDMMFNTQNPQNGGNGNVKSDTSDSTLSTPDGLKTGQNSSLNNCLNMDGGMLYNNLNRYDLNFYNNMYDMNSRINYTSSYPPANPTLHSQTTYRLPAHPSHPHASASFDQSYDQGYDPRLIGFRMPNSSMYSLGMPLPYHSHSNLMHPAYQTKPVPQVNKRYRCNLCGKGFSRPSSLTTHTYSHTGEKPFKCTVEGCGRSFSVVSNLRRHGKVHMNQH